jgi:hypothetical protein
MAGSGTPAFLGLGGAERRRVDLSEVTEAINAAAGYLTARPAPQAAGRKAHRHGPPTSSLGHSRSPMGSTGWLRSMGLTRADLCELVPVSGRVPSAFLTWWRLQQKDLADQLDMMRRCSFEQAIR